MFTFSGLCSWKLKYNLLNPATFNCYTSVIVGYLYIYMRFSCCKAEIDISYNKYLICLLNTTGHNAENKKKIIGELLIIKGKHSFERSTEVKVRYRTSEK